MSEHEKDDAAQKAWTTAWTYVEMVGDNEMVARSSRDEAAQQEAEPPAPAMSRSQIADAIWEGRLSIAEAERIDPTLKGLREMVGLTEEQVGSPIVLGEVDDLAPDDPGYRYADEIEAQLRDEYREHMAAIGIDPDDVGRPWGFEVDEGELEPDDETPQVFEHTFGAPPLGELEL